MGLVENQVDMYQKLTGTKNQQNGWFVPQWWQSKDKRPAIKLLFRNDRSTNNITGNTIRLKKPYEKGENRVNQGATKGGEGIKKSASQRRSHRWGC